MWHSDQQFISSLFRIYGDNGPGVLLVDSNLFITRVNPTFCKMLGYAEQELTNIFHKEIVHPDHFELNLTQMERLRHGGNPTDKCHKLYLHREGRPVNVIATTSMLSVDPDRGSCSYLSIVEDLDKPNSSNEDLNLFYEITHRMSDGMLVTDSSLRIVKFNPTVGSITGYSTSELLGRTPDFLISSRHGRYLIHKIMASLKDTEHWQGEIWMQDKNGQELPQWLRINVIRNQDGVTTHYVVIFSDISHHVQQNEYLHHLAHHDALTGLPNRLLFRDQAESAIRQARRSGEKFALLFIDLDDFKKVNDTHGHHVGDGLLKEVANRLREVVRNADMVARYGGDEFILIASGIGEISDAANVALKIIDAFEAPTFIGESPFPITMSIGITIFPDDAEQLDGLIGKADSAMYICKANKEGGSAFYPS